MEVAVVIPALNESASVPKVIDSIPRNSVCEIIVVDNGSTDDTAGAARRAGARVVIEPRRGYGSARLAGIAALACRPPPLAAFFDSGFSPPPPGRPLPRAPL